MRGVICRGIIMLLLVASKRLRLRARDAFRSAHNQGTRWGTLSLALTKRSLNAMRIRFIPVPALAACVGLTLLTACSDMNTQQQRMLSGGAIGAGVGAVGAGMTGGCATCGAVIGGAAGAGAGYLYDKSKKKGD
jgi:osmotically inducible lipoprotein OsmB